MPIYEYECKACSTRFEVKQSIVDEPIKTCPECKGAIRRVIFPVGIVFKGTGFYTTDHGKGRSSTVSQPSEESSAKPEDGKKEDKKEPAAAATAATGDKKTDV